MKSKKRENLLKGATSPKGGYHKDIESLKQNISDIKEKGPMKRFNVNLPEELHRELKSKAAKEGLKLNELAIMLFREYLSK